MDDLVAVEVRLADGGRRYFVTWGRIQDAVDPEPLCEVVLSAARHVSLRGDPVSARVCETLREAADSAEAPYFWECFFTFCQRPIPFGENYGEWRAAMDEAMRRGKEIAYCGAPASRADRTAPRHRS
jgi:hypothetical protein